MDDTSRVSFPPAGRVESRMPGKLIRYLLLLLVLGFAWRALFVLRDPIWITNFWLSEDFGYSLKIAKNIALGMGETFDGVIPTNAYQPLYVWLMVPVYWIFKNNLVVPLYIAATLLAAANVATGLFIFAIVRRLSGQPLHALLAVVFWMFNLAVAKNGTNGLETGLSTMMVAASLFYYLKHHRAGMALWRAGVLGLLLGVSFLARVDAVLLVVAVGIGMACDRAIALKDRAVQLAAAGVGFAIVAAPYVAWSMAHAGSPLPGSGQVAVGNASLFAQGGMPFSQLVSQFEYGCYIVFRMLIGAPSVNGWVAPPADINAMAATAVLVLLAAVCGFLVVSWSAPHSAGRKAGLVFGLAAIFYVCAYTVHTFLPFERYFLPVILIAALALPFAFSTLANPAGRTGMRRRIAILSCLAGAYFCNAGLAYWTGPEATPVGWYAGIEQLNALSRPGDVVAALQTGNTGYFYRNGRAINLDGAANGAAYAARKQGNLDLYLREQQVKYLADQRGWVQVLVDSVHDQRRRDLLSAALALRYRSADTNYEIFELLPDTYSAIRKLDGPGWGRREKKGFIGDSAMFASVPGTRLDFSSSGCFALKFLKHSWSGKVDVLRDGVRMSTINLFAPFEDETFRVSFGQDGQPHAYSLVVSNEKDAASQGHEVWFDAVLDEPGCSVQAPIQP